MSFNKKFSRRSVVRAVPAGVALLGMPAVWSSARAASDFTRHSIASLAKPLKEL